MTLEPPGTCQKFGYPYIPGTVAVYFLFIFDPDVGCAIWKRHPCKGLGPSG